VPDGIYNLNSPRESDAPPQVDPEVEFRTRLEAQTPYFYVTRIIVAINVLVYLAMIVAGLDVMHPAASSVIRWGANYGPKTIGGEWWRLLTSVFLHGGLLHVFFNMLVLWQVGQFVERLLGNAGFALVYLISGIAGGLTSLAWHPQMAGVGASGAIFGLFGALLGYAYVTHECVPSNILRSALFLVVFNVISGALAQGIDMAAHIGGLTAGFLCGVGYGAPMTAEWAGRRAIRNLATALTALFPLTITAALLPKPPDLPAALAEWRDTEIKSRATYDGAILRARTQHWPDERLADVLSNDLLPGYETEYHKLAGLQGLSESQERGFSLILRYMDGRRRAWSGLITSLRQHNPAGIQAAYAKQIGADSLIPPFLRQSPNPASINRRAPLYPPAPSSAR
jgi:rhomboid protease GluP